MSPVNIKEESDGSAQIIEPPLSDTLAPGILLSDHSQTLESLMQDSLNIVDARTKWALRHNDLIGRLNARHPVWITPTINEDKVLAPLLRDFSMEDMLLVYKYCAWNDRQEYGKIAVIPYWDGMRNAYEQQYPGVHSELRSLWKPLLQEWLTRLGLSSNDKVNDGQILILHHLFELPEPAGTLELYYRLDAFVRSRWNQLPIEARSEWYQPDLQL